MSSLHDNFYSDLNKKFMFELCKRTFSEEGKDISDQEELFTSIMKQTFQNTKASTIEDINRELVQNMIQELNQQTRTNPTTEISMATPIQPQINEDRHPLNEEKPILTIQNRLAPEESKESYFIYLIERSK